MENQITSRGFYLLIGLIVGVCIGMFCFSTPKKLDIKVETPTTNVITKADTVSVKK